MSDDLVTNERDIFECANQLYGYIGPDTEVRLAEFLKREGRAAADLAYEIVRLQSLLSQAYEDCAKIAEKDIRSEMSKKHHHKPDWYLRSLSIASAIRSKAKERQDG